MKQFYNESGERVKELSPFESGLTIVTNNHYYPILYWYELTPAEQKDFDYLDDESSQESALFFRYRGQMYDLGEFMRTRDFGKDSPLSKWYGYMSDSYFSGVLINFSEDNDFVQVARYYS